MLPSATKSSRQNICLPRAPLGNFFFWPPAGMGRGRRLWLAGHLDSIAATGGSEGEGAAIGGGLGVAGWGSGFIYLGLRGREGGPNVPAGRLIGSAS
jgi:hypothetical protein